MHGKFLGSFMLLAKDIDYVSNNMIDHHMCSENVCPCLDYEANYNGTTTADIYKGLNQGILATRNRNRANMLTPFFFTKDKDVGFKSFDQCYAFWYTYTGNKPRIDIKKIFGNPVFLNEKIS